MSVISVPGQSLTVDGSPRKSPTSGLFPHFPFQQYHSFPDLFGWVRKIEKRRRWRGKTKIKPIFLFFFLPISLRPFSRHPLSIHVYDDIYFNFFFSSLPSPWHKLASIFPSAASWGNWGSPASNLYPPHSMSHHVAPSHVTPHLSSYPHYAWPSPPTTATPVVSSTPIHHHQVDNFEIYKKLSPYE